MVPLGKADGAHDIVDVSAADDERWSPIDTRVPDATGLLVLGHALGQKRPPQMALEVVKG
jgi:hypothetical protein